jgi:hypothetical protein
MNSFMKAVNRRLQAFFGCKMKGAHYVDGSIAVGIQAHWYSTGECFRKSPHLHSWALPIRVADGKATNVDRFISKADLDQLKREWAKDVRKVAEELGFEGIEQIPDELVVDADYVPVLRNLKEKGVPSMNLRYDYRSPGQDLMNAVVGMDLRQELLIMKFKHNHEWDYYAIWKIDDFVREMQEKLAVRANHKTYGWFHRFDKNASVLGLTAVESKDDFVPVPELTENTVYRRTYETRFNEERRRLERRKRIFVRKAGDPDKPGFWTEVDPFKVKGEMAFFGRGKQYDYQVLRQ